MADSNQTLNQLATETSPYLLQHADNPVHWYPWNEEALRLAREQNKPVLLSIGYSACHWCHVMAHESFEDPATAAIMNEHFINIKVDREERPDLDRIYQRAHQLLTQRPGGWPLTMFLMHDDHVPFFGGTYFPKSPRHGLPAFTDLLTQIADFYRHRRDELNEQNASLMEAMTSLQATTTSAGEISSTELNSAALDLARRELEQSTDKEYGGLGRAPKFPHPFAMERLLRHWALTRQQDKKSLELACLTLDAMAQGGMNDQVGGGFCRYSVDDYWMIPHFEKMLYDNGPLLQVYTSAWQATAKPLYQRTVERTADWVLREMQSPEGGFWSSLDADSEGPEGKSEEGRFYVWEPEQVKALLDESEWQTVARHFGFDREANFEGHWHAHVYVPIDKLATEFNTSPDAVQETVDSACRKLFAERARRIHPGRDDKILTSWNALMIRGLAVAGRVFNRPDWIEAAERAFDFIHDKLYVNRRLLATYKDSKAHLNAYLDDYVFLIDAGLELLQSRWRDHDLEWLIELADTVLEQFEDKQNGGFFFTSHDHEKLIQRPKPFSDDSVPAGNGIACLALNRLGHVLGEMKYIDAVERTLKLAKSQYDNYPSAHNALMSALEEVLHPPEVITLRGAPAQMANWQQALQTGYHPARMILAIPSDSRSLPGILSERATPDEELVAWLCQGHQCRPPVADLESLQQQLAG